MTNWRELDRIRKNPDGFRALARALLAASDGLTEWETAFLESVAQKTGVEEFSTRQSEKLLQIRDDAQSIDTVMGFSVSRLVKGCHEARLDLSEEDEEWIAAIWKVDSPSIKRKHAGRLLRCSRQLGLIEDAA